jgi:hypothetical protein
MGNPVQTLEAFYEVESMPNGILGENVSTVATYKLNLREPVDCSGIEQKKIAMNQVSPYRGDPGDWILGTFEPTWKTKLAIPGHGSTTAGAVTITAFETLLGIIFGNSATIATGSTLTGAGTVTAPTTTDSGTLLPGQLIPIGTLGDGKGEGQCYPVVSHATTTLTLGIALQAVPGAGNVRYSGTMVYPTSDSTSSNITGIRMQVSSANCQYLMHGAFPTAVSISGLNPGEVPMMDVTWKAAWYEYKSSTFPTTVAGDTFQPAATAAGSLVVNTVGATTNTSATRRNYRDLTLDINIGTIECRGPGGFNAYQDIVGAKRGQDSCKLTWSEYAEATTTTPELPGFGTATNRKHAALTLSTADGSRVAFYFPSLRVMNVPRLVSIGGINGYRVECMAGVGATTTSALTLSKWRMLLA